MMRSAAQQRADDGDQNPFSGSEVGNQLSSVDSNNENSQQSQPDNQLRRQDQASQIDHPDSIQNSSIDLQQPYNSLIILKGHQSDQQLLNQKKKMGSFEHEIDEAEQKVLRTFPSQIEKGHLISKQEPILSGHHKNIRSTKNFHQVIILIDSKYLRCQNCQMFNLSLEATIDIIEKWYKNKQIIQSSFQLLKKQGYQLFIIGQLVKINIYLLEEEFKTQLIEELKPCLFTKHIDVFEDKQYGSNERTFYFDPDKLRNILYKRNFINLCLQVGPAKLNKSSEKFNDQFLAQVQQVQIVPSQDLFEQSCIGCSQFFSNGHLITDGSVNEIPAFGFPSAKNLSTIRGQIAQAVCSLLNSGGGIILFGVEKAGQKLVSVGQSLPLDKRMKIEKQIYQIVQNQLYPQLNFQEELKISFVTTMKTENSQPQIFVTRIRICPRGGQTTYFVRQTSNKDNIKCFNYKNRVKLELNCHQIVKLIKFKIRKFTINPILAQKQCSYLLTQHKDVFTHNCKSMIETESSQYQNRSELIDDYDYLNGLR